MAYSRSITSRSLRYVPVADLIPELVLTSMCTDVGSNQFPERARPKEKKDTRQLGA